MRASLNIRSALIAQYESPKPGAVARVETFVKLLGGQ